MPKRLTYEYVKEKFEDEGYVLVSNEYISAHGKLDYICSKGHKHQISWNNWQQGHKCPCCAGNVKLTVEFIKEKFKKEGYSLLSDRYTCANQKLDYVCPTGHEHAISWTMW